MPFAYGSFNHLGDPPCRDGSYNLIVCSMEVIQMRRYFSIAMFALLAILPLVAQTPQGWKVRSDRSTSASDPDAAGEIQLVTKGTGFRATNPQAAVFWNPANTITGNYSLKGTFTLPKPSGHTNYYGLVFGGSGLEGAGQNYVYFMVAQDGTWLIKRRNGGATSDIAKALHNAVRKPDANGRSTNALEVRVQADKVEYLVNGTTVHTTPKTGPVATTDGIYGFRVNHQLEVEVDGLAASKL
jgi:hypothetical protein